MTESRLLYALRPLTIVKEDGGGERGTSWVRALGGALVARVELLHDGRFCITASYGDGKWSLEGLDLDPYAASLAEALDRLERVRLWILRHDLEQDLALPSAS